MFKEFSHLGEGWGLKSPYTARKERSSTGKNKTLCETLQEDGSALALLTEKVPAKVCAD